MGDIGPTTTTTSQDKSAENVVVSKTAPATEYEQSLRIVLGTVFGVFGFLGIIILAVLLYRFCKNRRRQRRAGNSDRNTSLHRSVSIDLEQKQVPSILLLYSNDCMAHEKVVESLAGFLIETCNCNVHLDLFEEQLIHERGLDDWLVEKLQEAEFIIVLCSVGARLRCSKKKVKFKIDHNKTLPDYFAVAVDYVAEKMRVERSKGMPLSTFIVAYMDYSTASDIPPQLEMAHKFCLMREMTPLFCHLHNLNGEPTKDGVPILDISEETYGVSEMGTELRVAIDSAKEYFRSNPDWVEDRIEQVPLLKSKSRHCRKSSLEPLLGVTKKEKLTPQDSSVNHQISDEICHRLLPKYSKDAHQSITNNLQNRQNSFPSSLSSRQTIPTPPIQPQNSRSCENFQVAFTGTWSCDLCGREGHIEGSPECKGKETQLPQVSDFDDVESRSKSKSMPTVYRNSLYSSQTVLQAEVHKEWDDHDGKLSQADSQETSSNHDSIIDDLETDLRSIVAPVPAAMPVGYSRASYDKIIGRSVRAPGMATKLATVGPTIPTNFSTSAVKLGDQSVDVDVEIHEGKGLAMLNMTDDWKLDSRRGVHIQLEEMRL